MNRPACPVKTMFQRTALILMATTPALGGDEGGIPQHADLRNTACDDLVAAAMEVCLIPAKTRRLPQTLPIRLPKDLHTNKDFKYERTERGVVLRFDPDNVSRIRVRQLELKVQDGNSRTP